MSEFLRHIQAFRKETEEAKKKIEEGMRMNGISIPSVNQELTQVKSSMGDLVKKKEQLMKQQHEVREVQKKKIEKNLVDQKLMVVNKKQEIEEIQKQI